ncbi:MAG: L-serine ammonia-lyase, iron-sulfur-dependent, subunit alpha [Spirochaetota bacterium]|jgi:L-serine dehydratase|nr:L-serine ammonia-lyase, iron-sulfur-dependent, subunit alpha [Spirochaetota bacterium]
MESIREIYRIGAGPSSSHTMGPKNAAGIYKARYPGAQAFRVTLYGSLAATGKGHLTDAAIIEALLPAATEIVWRERDVLPEHPNGMRFELVENGSVCEESAWVVYSIGGGALYVPGQTRDVHLIYEECALEEITIWCMENGKPFWMYVKEHEEPEVWAYLGKVWDVMQRAMYRGLKTEGQLSGGLRLQRKARGYYLKAKRGDAMLRRNGILSAYALAVSEENAGGGEIVTAPTCGSCGILPAVLSFLCDYAEATEEDIIKGLATAGLVGNLVKANASISGAQVGCQGEVGTACAMAAAAAAQIMGGTLEEIEYAAEMGLEHHLGLTCDPVAGLVQIPCIERNAFAATRALDCADYSLLSDGRHRITFDEVVETMRQTGIDMHASYRETAAGGLARVYHPVY